MGHNRLLHAVTSVAATLILGSCGDNPVAIPDATVALDPGMSLDLTATAGGQAFVTACAGCHASHDGFDLAFFGFPDTTITRRAVHHVDTATALLIVHHIRSLGVSGATRDTRAFQVPRAESDEDFALRLFGADAWPEGLDEEGLLALDPTKVAAAVDFPLWSDEQSNLDWMPDHALPPEVLGPPDGPAQRALRAFHARPSDVSLVRAVATLRRAAAAPAGPCAQFEDGALADPDVCFEATRWIASLGAQYALRSGLDLADGVVGTHVVQGSFWDVGQAARRSLLKNEAPVPNAEENWVSWMYLGWTLAPGDHASVYTATGLARADLPRHATFLALRSMASRPTGSFQAYEDLAVAARHAPDGWTVPAYTTGLSVLEARQARGWAPGDDAALSQARTALEFAAATLVRRVGRRDAETLVARTRALRDQLGA